MPEPMRLLIVEDAPTDAEMAERVIRKAGMAFVSLRVETRDDFIRAIGGFKPDLILSDYNLPHFDGMSALRHAREMAPDVPFIIITGSINEETAVACMKAGADDYILKDRLARLPSAIESALENCRVRAGKREAEKALRETLQWQEYIFEGSRDAVFISDEASRFIAVNAAGERLTGYTRKELLGMSIPDLHEDVDLAAYRAFHDRIMAGEEILTEARMRKKDGTKVDTEFSNSRLVADGRGYMHTTARDITERKMAEKALRESEERFRMLFEQSPDGVVILDPETARPLEFNEAAHRQLGYSREEFARLSITDIDVDEAPDETKARIAGVFEKGREEFEARHRTREGEIRDVLVTAKTIQLQERPLYLCVWRDITDQEQAEAALRKSQASYRTLAENLPGIVYHLTLGEPGKMMFVNDMVVQLTGFSPAELTKGDVCSIEPLIVPEDREIVMRTVERAIERHEPFEVEYRVKHRDGGVRHFLEKGRPGRGSQGEGECGWIDGIILDITERKQAQIMLRTSELKFRTIFEGALDGIALTDLETQRLSAGNSAICKMLGYTPEEFVQLGVADLHTQEDWPQVLETFQKQARGELALAENTPVKRKDGSVFYADIQTSAVTLDDRNFMLGIFRDVTERQKAEASRDLLTRAMEQSHDAIIITDREASIVYTNPSFEKVTGYSSEEIRGKNPRILKSGLHDRAFYEEMWQTLLAGHSWRGRMKNRRKDGSLFTEESIISPVRDHNGDIAAFVAAKRDLTEEMHLQTRLAQAKNLETIGLIAGGVAHEVRNPLFAIATIVAALERKLADQPEFGEYVAHIKEQSSQLNQLMNDLLILGRPVEDAAFVPCELKDILGETHRQLLSVTASPHLCVLDAPKEPLVVRGIADKLAQVFLNVTGNAAAFSPEGQPIRIRLWREGDSAFVAVSDSGPGISEDLLPKIYQPFASKRKGGTGLGLAIVHKILEAHGGTVDARNNDPPPGATFTVRLPLASKEAPEGP